MTYLISILTRSKWSSI